MNRVFPFQSLLRSTQQEVYLRMVLVLKKQIMFSQVLFLQTVTQLFLTQSRSHFVDEDMEAQKGQSTNGGQPPCPAAPQRIFPRLQQRDPEQEIHQSDNGVVTCEGNANRDSRMAHNVECLQTLCGDRGPFFCKLCSKESTVPYFTPALLPVLPVSKEGSLHPVFKVGNRVHIWDVRKAQ